MLYLSSHSPLIKDKVTSIICQAGQYMFMKGLPHFSANEIKMTKAPVDTRADWKTSYVKKKNRFILTSVGAFLAPEQMPTGLVVLENYSGNKMPKDSSHWALEFPSIEC